MTPFKALVIDKASDGEISAAIETMPTSALPEGDVLLRVSHSSLNYKDGMILKGLGGLVKTYPHVPGIDLVGTVEESTDPDWTPGDKAILTGWRVGEVRFGGYAELARVKGDWLVPLPDGMRAQDAMTIGTAGLTAMLAVLALEDHGLRAGKGPVLVTGASGGVGSMATALLAAAGHDVAALTGRPKNRDYLAALGARETVPRGELAEQTKRPLEGERWAGAVDTVGGPILARLLGQIKYGGSVAACGLAASPDLPASVIPFLLRGINLLGIDSVFCPIARRKQAWSRLATDLTPHMLAAMAEVIGLEDLPAYADKILKGGCRGRVVVDLAR